jgi:hypothetical protein
MKSNSHTKHSTLLCNVPTMVMKELDFKEIGNGKITARIKQAAVLLGIILIGILISLAFNA